jgi:valyl-tRNA synthetase
MLLSEAKVVKLKAEGINKSDLTREFFLQHDWTDKYGGVILEQLKKLGASCDWERTKFTMDPDMSASVIRSFVGYITRTDLSRIPNGKLAREKHFGA